MPIGNVGSCTNDCATSVAAYILANYTVPAATPIPGSVDIGHNNFPLMMVTKKQWQNSISDVFGKTFTEDEMNSIFIYNVTWSSMWETQTDLSQDSMRQFITGAEKVSDYAAANVQTVAPACSNGTPNPTCVRTFIEETGKRLFRRPLTTPQITTLMNFYNDSNLTDASERFKAVVFGMLISPEFIYYDITGTNHIAVHPKNSALVELDPYEKCAKLAQVFLNSAPDLACLDLAKNAAAAGKTLTQAQVNSEANRMLATSKGQDHLPRYLRLMSGVEQTSLSQISDKITAAQWQALVSQFNLFLNSQVLQPTGNLKGIGAFFTASTYPIGRSTKNFFPGVNVGAKGDATENVALDANFYRGILGLPAFITTSYSDVFKGLTMYRQFLGKNLPNPTSIEIVNGRDVPAEERIQDITCNICHLKIDPMGFQVMRNFDESGILLTSTARNTATAAAPLLLQVGELAEQPFDSLASLSNLLANNEIVMCSFAKHYFSANERRSAETVDTDSWQAMCDEFIRNGGDFTTLPLSYVKTPAFNYIKAE
jgi:hypothetical protein